MRCSRHRPPSDLSMLPLMAEKGHVRKLAQALKGRMDPNGVDAVGNSALHTAWANTVEQRVGMVQRLIVAGANPNLLNDQDESPLVKAIQVQAPLAVLIALVEGGAEVRANHDAALKRAVKSLDWEAFEWLLAHGAMQGGLQNGDWTVLHMAASLINDGSERYTQALLDAGAPVDVKDQFGRTPMALARRQNVAVLRRWMVQQEQALLQGVAAGDEEPSTPLVDDGVARPRL